MTDKIDVSTIIENWLREHDAEALIYDGLWNEECGCCVDDLMPCGVDSIKDLEDCRPGYRQHHGPDEPCPSREEGEPCNCIGPHKPAQRGTDT